MLTDYIVMYAKARKEENKKLMAEIERDLKKLGMDKLTLSMLADEADAGYIREVKG